MTSTAPYSERLRAAFEPTARGIDGLVDALLDLGRDFGLHIGYQDGHCQVRRGANGAQDPIAIPLRKSIFRAALARVASLCNVAAADSVSPYGGEGELLIPSPEGHEVVRVKFTNTGELQKFEARVLVEFTEAARRPQLMPIGLDAESPRIREHPRI